jgi:hypothetical protein
MAEEDQIPEEVERAVNEAVGDTGTPRKSKQGPAYQLVGKSKIPVSKHLGKLWKVRKIAGEAAMKDDIAAWDEAIRYYNHDQGEHRKDEEGTTSNNKNSRRLGRSLSETENIVYANVNVMKSALYARNPSAEFTSHNEEAEKLANLLEDIVNAVTSRRAAPGINLKPKAKRAIVNALLTNNGWLKLGWTNKQDSSEQAYMDLKKLGEEYAKAKNPKEIEEIEGKLSALEESIDMLSTSGPYACVKLPHDIIIDPDSAEPDYSDARWMMERDYLPTNFLTARYGKKVDDEVRMIFQPTHVMKITKSTDEGGSEHDNVAFSLYTSGSHTDFGFEDSESFERAKVTMCWWVWDRITRRLLLFNNSDWTWPLWVWDDPYNLDTFFPYYCLSFHDNPTGKRSKGEVSYYLDQQDSLNEIADERKRARRWARRNVFFNKNLVSAGDVEAVLKGDDGTARGLDLPEGMKLGDVVGSITPPSMQFEQLFNKDEVLQAVDRISSVGEVMRGGQFKTNTNTAAVQTNVSAANLRVDDKSDEIEDWIGAFCWGLAQLCLQYMDREQVRMLVGDAKAADWDNMSAQQIAKSLSMSVVGGSTKKPTSQAKKEEALELGQVLGQFVNAAPVVVTTLMLQVFERAFDEITIDDRDWEALRNSISNQQQQTQGAPQQPDAAGQQATGAAPDVQQLLSQIPPEVKQKAMSDIEAGVPAQQAITSALRSITRQ